jgi:hypothetical protein
MYFSHRTTAILMAAVASTQAAPQMALSSITTVAPTVITGDKMGTAAFSDDYTSTMVVYQAADSSVQLLSGSGPPSSASSYATSVILAAGIARNDTPLALAVDNAYYHIVSSFRILLPGNIVLTAAFFFNRSNICSTSAPPNAPGAITFTSYSRMSLSMAGRMARSIH